MRRLLPASASALVTLAAITLVGPGLAGPGPRSDSHNPAVIELFTSQGCSSCPAADALLGQLAERPGFVALSYSVDYWDYLGWRDTLGSPANSERQRDYAKARGDGRVYTPQAVVDGVTHANGSDEDAIQAAVAAASVRLAQVKVPVSMHGEGDTLVIDVGAAPETSDQRSATIWLAIAKEVEKVVVARGENRGRELSYHHPVRELTPIGMWHGEAVTLRLPLKDLETMGGDCLFALLQVEDSGPILGAAEFEPH
ncbi:MAG: DUF1223 domain-containing protein [Methyloceanibacter sp.]